MTDEQAAVQQTASIFSPAQFIGRIIGTNLFGGGPSPPPPPPPSAADVTPVFLRGRSFTSGDETVDRQLEQDLEQALALRFLRPAAQLTREPVPVRVSPPAAPAPTPAPIVAPEPSQEARERSEVVVPEENGVIHEIERIFAMADGFSSITGALGELSGLVSGVGGLLGRGLSSTQGAPVIQAGFVGPAIRAIGGVAGGAALGSAVTGFFGNGGNGTALQRIKADAGRSITRAQVIRMARVCGLDVTARTLNSSVENVCEVVAKGMPRRGRGISSRDMSRTRSTLSKLNTMQRSLSSLCPPTRRRSPRRK